MPTLYVTQSAKRMDTLAICHMRETWVETQEKGDQDSFFHQRELKRTGLDFAALHPDRIDQIHSTTTKNTTHTAFEAVVVFHQESPCSLQFQC